MVPSPWGDPARMPPVSATAPASSAPPAGPARKERANKEMERQGGVARVRPPAHRVTIPVARRRVHGRDHPSRPEQVRAAATLAFVAIILGAAAAGVLGISVWAIAALFHHAASG